MAGVNKDRGHRVIAVMGVKSKARTNKSVMLQCVLPSTASQFKFANWRADE